MEEEFGLYKEMINIEGVYFVDKMRELCNETATVTKLKEDGRICLKFDKESELCTWWSYVEGMVKLIEEKEKEAMNKFKVGDVVKPNKEADSLYCITCERGGMTEGLITSIYGEDVIKLKITKGSRKNKIGESYNVNPKYFSLVKSDKCKIVIEYDGESKTKAYLYEDDKLVKTATTRKHPDDEHDMKEATRVVTERLFEEVKEIPKRKVKTLFYDELNYGTIGTLTNLKTVDGIELYVGDIVEVDSILRVIVSNESYEKPFFLMGFEMETHDEIPKKYNAKLYKQFDEATESDYKKCRIIFDVKLV